MSIEWSCSILVDPSRSNETSILSNHEKLHELATGPRCNITKLATGSYAEMIGG
jgi:hypothetical protein